MHKNQLSQKILLYHNSLSYLFIEVELILGSSSSLFLKSLYSRFELIVYSRAGYRVPGC